MHVIILVKGLGVLRVSGEWVGAVESAGVGAVPSGAEVILLQVSIKLFAGI